MKNTYTFNSELPILALEWIPVTYNYPLHWHTCLEIGYCTSGTGWFHFHDKTYEATAGDIFIVNNVEKHMTQSSVDNPNHYYFVKFDMSLLEQHEKELLLPFAYDPRHFTNKIAHTDPLAPQLASLITTIWQECQLQAPAYTLVVRSTLITICALLLRHYLQHKNHHRQASSHHVVDLQPALTFIRAHYREKITLDDIAAQLSLSPSRTYHLFKEMTGKGFKEYVNLLRINEAKALLIETRHTTMEICYACGFQSHTPFYRAFKNAVGMTPLAYRERCSLLPLHSENPPQITSPETHLRAPRS